jgi:TonB family protein
MVNVDASACSDDNAGRMRIFEMVLILVACTLPLAAEDVSRAAYVDCSSGDKHRLIPVFQNPCASQPAGTLSCGQDVKVLGREGPWLKIATTHGGESYISILAVSQRIDRFVALDLPVPPGPYIPDCSAFRPKTGRVHPRAIYSPDPEYTDKARKKKISGTVALSLTVGTDGRAHDIKVSKRLGYGLDENAVKAVQSWKWEPALEEGTPIESRVSVDVHFNLF